jgi:hypothetical protein
MNTLSTPLRRALRHPFRALVALAALPLMVGMATPAYASSTGLTNAQREALAHREVTSLLGAAPRPAGSRQITAAEAETIKPFSGEKGSVYGANEVGAVRFYVAPSAQASLTWLKSQHLEGHAAAGSGTSSSTHTEVFLLSNTDVLEQPEVVYIALVKPNGTLEFSVTASVWWTSQKSALAAVPSGATSLSVKLNRGINAKKTDRTSSVTTHDKSLITAIIDHINALPVPSPLPTSCPNDVGASVTMSFYRGGAAKPYSVVVADPGGCGPVTISQYNSAHVRTSAADVTGGVGLSEFVADHLGLTNLDPS